MNDLRVTVPAHLLIALLRDIRKLSEESDIFEYPGVVAFLLAYSKFMAALHGETL